MKNGLGELACIEGFENVSDDEVVVVLATQNSVLFVEPTAVNGECGSRRRADGGGEETGDDGCSTHGENERRGL